MSVNKGDRRESRVEFDNTYFKVYDDCVRLIECSCGAKGDIKEKKQGYIRAMSDRVLKSVCDMGTYIRIANSIYPQYKSELEERRIAQEKAIGLCFDVMTKYQLIMTELKVPDDKHTNEIKNLIHEINCLKKWRESDKRFKNLG